MGSSNKVVLIKLRCSINDVSIQQKLSYSDGGYDTRLLSIVISNVSHPSCVHSDKYGTLDWLHISLCDLQMEEKIAKTLVERLNNVLNRVLVSLKTPQGKLDLCFIARRGLIYFPEYKDNIEYTCSIKHAEVIGFTYALCALIEEAAKDFSKKLRTDENYVGCSTRECTAWHISTFPIYCIKNNTGNLQVKVIEDEDRYLWHIQSLKPIVGSIANYAGTRNALRIFDEDHQTTGTPKTNADIKNCFTYLHSPKDLRKKRKSNNSKSSNKKRRRKRSKSKSS